MSDHEIPKSGDRLRSSIKDTRWVNFVVLTLNVLSLLVAFSEPKLGAAAIAFCTMILIFRVVQMLCIWAEFSINTQGK